MSVSCAALLVFLTHLIQGRNPPARSAIFPRVAAIQANGILDYLSLRIPAKLFKRMAADITSITILHCLLHLGFGRPFQLVLLLRKSYS